MLGLGSLITGTLFVGSAIKKAVDNADVMSKPIDWCDGTPIYRNIDGNYVVHGEKCFRDSFIGSDGHEHVQFVGMKSRKVYCDKYNEKKNQYKTEEMNRIEAYKNKGKNAYLKYYKGSLPMCSNEGYYVTEISTGKPIVKMETDLNGTYFKKWYARGDQPYLWSTYARNEEGICISREEYESLNLEDLWVSGDFVGGNYGTEKTYMSLKL